MHVFILKAQFLLRTQTVAISRRPVLSVRRRLINSPTTAAATITTLTSSIYNNDFTATTESPAAATTSKFNSYSNNNNINRRTRPTATTLTKYSNKNIYNQQFNAKYKTKNSAAATESLSSSSSSSSSSSAAAVDLNVSSSSSSSATAASANDITQNHQPNQQQPQQQEKKYNSSPALRRKFQQRRIITTTTASPSDETANEQQRTQNPLFKRRYSFISTTPRPLPPTLTTPTATTTLSPHDSLTTTLFVDGLDNDDNADQVAKSSIHSSLFNRIADEGEDDDDEANKQLLLSAIKTTRKTAGNVYTTTTPATTLPAETSQQFVESITRRMDSFSNGAVNTLTTRKPSIRRRPQKTTPIPLTLSPVTVSRGGGTFANRRRPHKVAEPFERLNRHQTPTAEKQIKAKDAPGRTYRPTVDYDYYDDEDVRVVGNTAGQQLKVILHGRGIIECLDQGNFPHPLSCRKFISCAKFETGGVVGWEYTCPKGLSYDPVGGMCNWAAGLGCKE